MFVIIIPNPDSPADPPPEEHLSLKAVMIVPEEPLLPAFPPDPPSAVAPVPDWRAPTPPVPFALILPPEPPAAFLRVLLRFWPPAIPADPPDPPGDPSQPPPPPPGAKE